MKTSPELLPPIRQWPRPYRIISAIFILTLFSGFLMGLFFVKHHTSMTPGGIVQHYNGNKSNEEIIGELRFAKSLPEFLATTHNHILGLSVIFLAVAFLYLHTGSIGQWKLLIATEPFISLITTFSGLWLVRFIHPYFSHLVIISGMLMVLTFCWMCFAILYASLNGNQP